MDAERVQTWFEAGTLLKPDPSLPGTVSLARALGHIGGAGIELDGPARRVAEAIGADLPIILVLADGLGLDLVNTQPRASFLRSHLAMELRSVFPSSTAPALTSLATGTWPAEHGLLGWFAYLPDHEVQIITLPFRERFTSRSLASLGIDGEEVFAWRALVRSYGRPARFLMPAPIAGTTYTRSIGGGVMSDAYQTLDLAIERLIQLFRTPNPPGYVYFYYARIDSVTHDHGPTSVHVQSAVQELDRALLHLHEQLGGRARIVVTSDHGAIDLDRSKKVIIRPDDRAAGMLLTPPSGEPRAPLFHVRPGAAAEFAEAFRSQFGGHFALLTAAEVIGLGLLGPGRPAEVTRQRMGDFMALSDDGTALVYSPDRGYLEMAGFHGGLDPREVRIPLIVA